MEEYLENLQKSIKNMHIADHMIYITYPVIKDKRLLMKTLEHINDAVVCLINAILQYEQLHERIILQSNSNENLELFISKCSTRYNLTHEENEEIREILATAENHKKSSLEFSRKEKLIIMSDSLKTTAIDAEKLKKYLSLAKRIINKAKFAMSIL